MTRDEILDKAARAMFDARNLDPVGRYGTALPAWMISALRNNRSIFTTGLDAVEDDIRRDERQRIANEMLALREELKVVGRLSAAAVMHDMWQRVTRRLDK